MDQLPRNYAKPAKLTFIFLLLSFILFKLDFTLTTYHNLLISLLDSGYVFQPYIDYLKSPAEKVIILRHDVDKRPGNSLTTALMEHELGIRGTYYFRIVPQSFDEKIIKKIHGLGHEIGYHYEDMSLMAQRHKGVRAEKDLVKYAIESFAKNLEKLRFLVPITTICMHGSPLSRWDSRLLWKHNNYRDFGIEVEPYFKFDFSERLYLTDTGRSWSSRTVSVRDKVSGDGHRATGNDPYDDWVVKPAKGSLMNMTEEGVAFQNRYRYKTTHDIIAAAEAEELPDKIMMTFHPQRWTEKPLPWIKELVWQNVKNVGKYFLVKMRD